MSLSARSRSRMHSARRPGLLAVPLVATMALTGVMPGGVTAQSATPVASSNCAPSVLISAPNIPDSTATPQAVAAVDAETSTAITTLIDSLASCLTDGNADTVAALVTDRYLADAYGGGERMTRDDYVALAPLAPVIPVMVVSVGEITFTGRDTASAQVITVQGNQLRTEEWTFLFRRSRDTSGTPVAGNATGEGQWLVHQVEPRPSNAPQGASTMTGTITEYSISLSPSTAEGPAIVVAVENTGQESHEFLALKLDSGASIEQLIRPTSDEFPSNIHVIGQETIPAGETRTLVFVDLEPGTYTVVCLLPDADGVPHLALGETTTFTVE